MENRIAPHLSRKEEIKLRKALKLEQWEQAQKRKKLAIWAISILTGIGLLFAGWLLVRESSKPLPGTAVPDLGQNHVTDITKVKYNSNPPTSGPHFAVWAKKGQYDRVISDGHLIHSLEHGYIVISYNCNLQEREKTAATSAMPPSLLKMKVSAKDDMSFFTPDNPPAKEVDLPASFSLQNCKALVSKLTPFLDRYDRVIIVPRPNLDSRIALTAWTRIEKMNEVDSEKIEAFIAVFHNNGPEKTIE